jgi:hypothetical protein
VLQLQAVSGPSKLSREQMAVGVWNPQKSELPLCTRRVVSILLKRMGKECALSDRSRLAIMCADSPPCRLGNKPSCASARRAVPDQSPMDIEHMLRFRSEVATEFKHFARESIGRKGKQNEFESNAPQKAESLGSCNP